MDRMVGALLVWCLAIPLRAERVVVLAFFNRTDAAALDWIGESLAESVREALVAAGMAVVDREARQTAYRKLSVKPLAPVTKATVLKIGEVVEADTEIFGSFRVREETGKSVLEVEAQLVDRKGLRNGPSFRAGGPLEELVALQEEIAWQVLRALRPQSPGLEEFRKRRRAVRLDALEQYIRGLMAESPEQKHRYFTQAARLDASFSQPRFQLGKLLWRKKEYRVAAGWLEQVSPEDVHYPESLFLLGLCLYYAGDYETAALRFRALTQASPTPEVWNNLGAAQSRLNLPEALNSFRKALEASPEDPVYRFNVGYALWRRGDYESAAEMFRAVLRAQPHDAVAMTMLGRCLKRSGPGRIESRVEALERLKYEWPSVPTDPDARAELARSGKSSGRRGYN
jgi:tetratricopeptide (TPR) repeat protein